MRRFLGIPGVPGNRRRTRSALLGAAITCVEQWRWPVVPGALPASPPAPGLSWGPAPAESAEGDEPLGTGCSCPRPDCPVPGAHPHDPPLLAATTDPRMVRWWWTTRPTAPLVVATGERVAAVSLPAVAGARLLDYLDALRHPVGPVIATPTRYLLLVAPYTHEELAELLMRQESVPTSVRYHGPGGYVLLPPSRTAAGELRWVREPVPPQDAGAGARAGAEPVEMGVGGVAPWLPPVADFVDALVAAGSSAPDGTRLAY
ncbi:bifunctional DNA primase/polymerase [Phaeacidiphilus oryzae]|uniref:bifunctional DNA primase/polymerase n=1 Tax=Phaeacidiphilus oryzae TaxID=348818 RepID=UPI00055FD9D6|nr:bifunctional DNA primase/polymerase [Phaeacidiphilus oryzae]